MTSTGKAMAVWAQNDGTRDNIWANAYSGTGWGTAQKIETGSGDAADPQVIMAESGSAIALWHQDSETAHAFDIWYNIYN